MLCLILVAVFIGCLLARQPKSTSNRDHEGASLDYMYSPSFDANATELEDDDDDDDDGETTTN